MNKLIRIVLTSLCVLLASASFATDIVLKGVYQGKDLYVKNPFGGEGVGFCVYQVMVNGEVTSDEVNSSAFAVDLAQYAFKIGDPVVITIRHKDDCEPKIINPESIQPRSTFEIQEIQLDATGKLTWAATGETGVLPYVVEHFKWNKWVAVSEVKGKGSPERAEYSTSVRLVNGENQVRLKQMDGDGVRYSKVVKVSVDQGEVTMLHTKVFHKIEFSRATDFELYSEYGELVATGYGPVIDTSDLKPGVYYVNYGSHFGEKVTRKQ